MTAAALSIACLLAAALRAQQNSAPVVVQPGAPGAPSKRLPLSTTAVAPRISQADIEFMQGMIMHHGQAVEMTALIPTHTENAKIRALGARISSSQSDEMNFMKRWLVAHGQPISMAMPGMLTPQQMDALRQAKGLEFDRLFLTGMIQHHNGALTMVKQLFEAAGSGQDADLFQFATDADNSQRAEINIMQGILEEKR